jgi:hypothetical protein
LAYLDLPKENIAKRFFSSLTLFFSPELIPLTTPKTFLSPLFFVISSFFVIFFGSALTLLHYASACCLLYNQSRR